MEFTLTEKGQTTIPKAIREHLGVEPGERIKFFIHPDGSVVILPKIPTSALKGMIASRRRKAAATAPSIDEMHEAIVASATARQRRLRKG